MFGVTYRRVFGLKDSATSHAASCTYRDHDSGNDGALLDTRSLVVTVRQRCRYVALRTPCRQEQAKIARCWRPGIQDEKKTNDGDDRLADENWPSQADLV